MLPLCLQNRCNRWSTNVPSIFWMWTYRNKDSELFLTNMWMSHTWRYLHQSPHSATGQFHSRVTAKKPKMFLNSSKHITEQLIPFSCSHSFQMWMPGILELEISLHRATLVENMCRLRPHCTPTYPSSTRGTAITKTFTALWKNTVQPSHNLSTQPSVCLNGSKRQP